MHTYNPSYEIRSWYGFANMSFLWSTYYLPLFLQVVLISFAFERVVLCEDVCEANSHHKSCGEKDTKTTHNYSRLKRYLLYDVNPGEGFNLRRDVYMRVATLVNKLRQNNENEDWILVLPPWGPLYHWKSKGLSHPQFQIPWSAFFDISSLAKYVPVIEFEDYLKENNVIEEVYYLQHYPDGWENGKWEERFDIASCAGSTHYTKNGDRYQGWFWGYTNVHALHFHCLSVQGYASTLLPLFHDTTEARSVMLDRAEVILHDMFGDVDYWRVRRSMRFAEHLRQIGDEFRVKYLNSSDTQDGTQLESDWRNMKALPGSARGGPYLAVHLRRQDFARSRPNDVPSIEYAVEQIKKHLQKLKLDTVFIATDATKEELEQLKSQLQKVYHYKPTLEDLKFLGDGGVAIIDQWICAHARYFIGTHESTFSFRIQEEREILGFHPDTTFNSFCAKPNKTCKQPSRWRITYGSPPPR